MYMLLLLALHKHSSKTSYDEFQNFFCTDLANSPFILLLRLVSA
jgi:hypothetical protein